MGEAKLEYCKIVPLSKSKVFAAIGATRYIEGGEIRYDAGDTAKAASFATDSSASTLTMAELWKNWTITNIRKFEQSERDELINLQKENEHVATGIFASVDGDELRLVKATIKIDDVQHSSLDFMGEITEIPFGDEPQYRSFGQDSLFGEFFNKQTDRAQAVWHVIQRVIEDESVPGAAKNAFIVKQLVQFVIRWSENNAIGGEVPVVILDRHGGISWYNRPSFCIGD